MLSFCGDENKDPSGDCCDPIFELIGDSEGDADDAFAPPVEDYPVGCHVLFVEANAFRHAMRGHYRPWMAAYVGRPVESKIEVIRHRGDFTYVRMYIPQHQQQLNGALSGGHAAAATSPSSQQSAHQPVHHQQLSTPPAHHNSASTCASPTGATFAALGGASLYNRSMAAPPPFSGAGSGGGGARAFSASTTGVNFASATGAAASHFSGGTSGGAMAAAAFTQPGDIHIGMTVHRACLCKPRVRREKFAGASPARNWRDAYAAAAPLASAHEPAIHMGSIVTMPPPRLLNLHASMAGGMGNFSLAAALSGHAGGGGGLMAEGSSSNNNHFDATQNTNAILGDVVTPRNGVVMGNVAALANTLSGSTSTAPLLSDCEMLPPPPLLPQAVTLTAPPTPAPDASAWWGTAARQSGLAAAEVGTTETATDPRHASPSAAAITAAAADAVQILRQRLLEMRKRGNRAHARGDYKLAVQRYSEALELAPCALFLNPADHARVHRQAAATPTLTRASVAGPSTFATATHPFALAPSQCPDRPHIVGGMHSARELAKDCARLLCNRATTYFELRDYTAMWSDTSTALTLAADDEQCLLSAANACSIVNYINDADLLFYRAVQLRPEAPEPRSRWRDFRLRTFFTAQATAARVDVSAAKWPEEGSVRVLARSARTRGELVFTEAPFAVISRSGSLTGYGAGPNSGFGVGPMLPLALNGSITGALASCSGSQAPAMFGMTWGAASLTGYAFNPRASVMASEYPPRPPSEAGGGVRNESIAVGSQSMAAALLSGVGVQPPAAPTNPALPGTPPTAAWTRCAHCMQVVCPVATLESYVTDTAAADVLRRLAQGDSHCQAEAQSLRCDRCGEQYCSAACRTAAWEEHHWVACPRGGTWNVGLRRATAVMHQAAVGAGIYEVEASMLAGPPTGGAAAGGGRRANNGPSGAAGGALALGGTMSPPADRLRGSSKSAGTFEAPAANHHPDIGAVPVSQSLSVGTIAAAAQNNNGGAQSVPLSQWQSAVHFPSFAATIGGTPSPPPPVNVLPSSSTVGGNSSTTSAPEAFAVFFQYPELGAALRMSLRTLARSYSAVSAGGLGSVQHWAVGAGIDCDSIDVQPINEELPNAEAQPSRLDGRVGTPANLGATLSGGDASARSNTRGSLPRGSTAAGPGSGCGTNTPPRRREASQTPSVGTNPNASCSDPPVGDVPAALLAQVLQLESGALPLVEVLPCLRAIHRELSSGFTPDSQVALSLTAFVRHFVYAVKCTVRVTIEGAGWVRTLIDRYERTGGDGPGASRRAAIAATLRSSLEGFIQQTALPCLAACRFIGCCTRVVPAASSSPSTGVPFAVRSASMQRRRSEIRGARALVISPEALSSPLAVDRTAIPSSPTSRLLPQSPTGEDHAAPLVFLADASQIADSPHLPARIRRARAPVQMMVDSTPAPPIGPPPMRPETAGPPLQSPSVGPAVEGGGDAPSPAVERMMSEASTSPRPAAVGAAVAAAPRAEAVKAQEQQQPVSLPDDGPHFSGAGHRIRRAVGITPTGALGEGGRHHHHRQTAAGGAGSRATHSQACAAPVAARNRCRVRLESSVLPSATAPLRVVAVDNVVSGATLLLAAPALVE